jgi:hypothetical protein
MKVLTETARDYRTAGLSILPAWRKEKRPAIKSWKSYQERLPTEIEINAWFTNNHEGVCIVTGKISGNLEIIDFDNKGELFDAWSKNVPGDLFDRLVIESTPSGGWHVIYKCESEICGNLKLSQGTRNGKLVTLIETRGNGGLFLCTPTSGYEILQGDLKAIPIISESERDILLRAAWELNEYWPENKIPPIVHENKDSFIVMPGDDFNEKGDAMALLERYGWKYIHSSNGSDYFRRPGKNNGSWSASLKDNVFYVFSSNAHPFEANRGYSLFSIYAILEHGGDYTAAAKALLEKGYGSVNETKNTGVDLSGILDSIKFKNKIIKDDIIKDPGPLPEELLYVPGFISEVMDYTLRTAPYPNKILAFAGALSIQGFLAGRKIMDNMRNLTNIYLIALADSGTGKEHPRLVNREITFASGLSGKIGDSFASGEGIEDVMHINHAMLFQTDEIDSLMMALGSIKDARTANIVAVLLKMFSSSSSTYDLRIKAGDKTPRCINKPSLTLFGTAIPEYFYESLNPKMLKDGLMARSIVMEAGERGKGQEPDYEPLPDSIIQTARWWADFTPGNNEKDKNNFAEINPFLEPIPFEKGAKEYSFEMMKLAEKEYMRCKKVNDLIGQTEWTRVFHKARRLALIFAASQNRENPTLTVDALEWGWKFMKYHTEQMIFKAHTRVSENPFHAECQKLLEKLRKSIGGRLSHSVLLKRMKIRSKDFKEIIETLLEQGDLEMICQETEGRTGRFYKLTSE